MKTLGSEKRIFTVPNLLICFFLVAAVAVVYSQVISFAFINFDDNSYIIDNPNVLQGLTAENIIWAFSTESGIKNYWHPLVWVSFMLDAEFFGAWPGQFHFSNVLIHTISVVMLYAVFYKMTGSLFRSSIIAALFAIHPINVESVAWIAERKNVLSTLFLLLTLFFYIDYAQKKSIAHYFVALFFFVCGLFSKPMLVSLPVLLFLLDYWPLRRMEFDQNSSHRHGGDNRRWLHLVLEKVPFLFLSLGSIYISSITLDQGDKFISFATRPLSLRIANALNSYLAYIAKLLWPGKLAIFYPYPLTVSIPYLVGAVFLLAFISGFTIFTARRYPYLIVGWFWYIIALIPVSGLIQAGLWPAMADRYAYVPFIGLFLIISWGMNDLLKRNLNKGKRVILFSAFLIILLPVSWIQAGKWREDITLFEHAAAVTSDNSLAHSNLGAAYYKSGKIFEAIDHFSEAVKIQPNYDKALSNLGSLYYLVGRPQEAIGHLQQALVINPDMDAAKENLNKILQELNKMNDALEHYNTILRNDPNDPVAHYNAGLASFRLGKINEAIAYFQESVRIKPDMVSAQKALALARNSARHKNL